MRTERLTCVAVLACVIAASATGCRDSPTPDEITVRRINIVDQSGQVKLVIGGELPGPTVRGERLERAIVPAGILWYDANGDESGGLVVAAVPGWQGASKGNVRMITFDFTKQITDAVRLDTFESEDGDTWSGGVTVFDRRPYEAGPVKSSQGRERIYLGTRSGDAGLVIRDSNEKERIRMRVDRAGAGVIEILDESGEVAHRFPERRP